MKHVFTDTDLIELDRIWPLGRQLAVPENGTIVVAGVYEGRYCHFLSELFPTATVYGYEPDPDAFLTAAARVGGAHLFNVGLATANRQMALLNGGTDGASVVASGSPVRGVQMDAVTAFHTLPPIDLLVLNVEGYEWTLLPYLLGELMHHRIASMAIQFHPEYVTDNHVTRVLNQLGEYYERTYWEWPSWVNVQRRNSYVK